MRPDITPMTDERTLIERFLKSRSDAAFAALYAAGAPRLYGLIVRLLGPGSPHVDDAFQESWSRAIAMLPGFRSCSRFSTWLCGIAVNVCREVRRRDARDAAPQGEAEPDPAAPPFDHANRIDLERALAQIAAGYREVLLLHDVHGFTHEEIAAQLGVEPGTSKSQLSRARAAMRAALATHSPKSESQKESAS